MEWVARRLGLEEYETAFRENEISWRAQPNLTAEGLKELGCLAGLNKPLDLGLAATSTQRSG